MTDNKRSPESISKNRIRITEAACIAVSILFTSFFTYKYLVKPLIKPEAERLKNNIIYDAVSPYMIEGDITDRNGDLILGYASAGVRASANHPANFSSAWLLGYYNVNDNYQNSFGLRGNLKNYSLFTLDKNNHGADVQLTIDQDLQDYAFQLLDGKEGSVTVLDNHTGEIICLTSQSTVDFDVNDSEKLLTSTIPESQFRRGTFETDPPGSTFKVITAAAALTMQEEENIDDSFFLYEDNGSYIPDGSDFVITNFQNQVFGTIDMNTALAKSCNCYFADLGVRIGAKRLQQAMDAFMIGKDIEIPYLDVIHSGYDIGDHDNAMIAQTAFGQGNTTMTPLHIAMIAQTIANDGIMLRPYIVSKIQSGNLTLYKGNQKVLSQAIGTSVSAKIKKYMHDAALEYGLNERSYGMIYAKTGTAECANNRIHSYLMGFNDRYSFCISANNNNGSSELYWASQQLVNYLNSMQ